MIQEVSSILIATDHWNTSLLLYVLVLSHALVYNVAGMNRIFSFAFQINNLGLLSTSA